MKIRLGRKIKMPVILKEDMITKLMEVGLEKR